MTSPSLPQKRLLLTLLMVAASAGQAGAPPSAAQGASAPTVLGTSAPTSVKRHSKAQAPNPVKLVNLNSATREELKTLPGITDREADRIIARRPYHSKGWLVSKKVLTPEQALAVRDQVEAGRLPPKRAHKD